MKQEINDTVNKNWAMAMTKVRKAEAKIKKTKEILSLEEDILDKAMTDLSKAKVEAWENWDNPLNKSWEDWEALIGNEVNNLSKKIMVS